MKYSISIDQDKCTHCLHCVKVCPVEIFIWNKEDKQVELQNENRCIACGHCVAACAYEAVQHSEFDSEKVHPTDYNIYPTPQQMMEIIRNRRSNRAFSKKAIPEETLDMIVEAAYRAPTATNQQKLEFVLITSPDKLKVLSDFTMETFGGMLKKMNNPIVKGVLKMAQPQLLRYIPLFKEMQKAYADGKDGILRGATAVLLIYTPKKCRFGESDANLAYQNASLMAESCGITQFYTGFIVNASRSRKGKLEELLGIDGEIYAGMAMAVPLFKMDNYIDRRPIKLKRM